LPPGTLDRLLALAVLAPSVGLSEPWRFVEVCDPHRRAAVREEFAACNADALAAQAPADRASYAVLKLEGLDRAPCQLAVFADADPSQGRGLGRRTMPDTAAWSAVLALHTLWLAARAEGIGLGWISILRPERVAVILDTPPAWRLVAYCCLGFPEREHDAPELERLGWERRHPPVLLRR
ncbi:MAG: 5,6-dimethylbenzimidazole synthase, partial [Gluconacetobacter diazotrophicus]|nr:5,6-dimethylbenzimidazole synthase [Gluconacetobacter diazotrophicus]